uniref:Myosinlike protein putative n=1 Tax=Albugo laibachii Nc14 TaxID=890382 RepID=F0WPF5_9STRA|nr:myosinlike protein putative [Albugo laibachii Nc14]|eukprot:CCA23203.1 myosinlike protein putative [Albugo laibachii Nc14]
MAQERDFQVIQKLHSVLESPVDASVLCWTEDGHQVRLLYRRRPQLHRLLQVSFRVFHRILSKYLFTHLKDITTRDDLYFHPAFGRSSRPECVLQCFTKQTAKKMDALEPSKSELQWPLVSFDSKFGPLEIQFQIRTTGEMEGCQIIVAPTTSMPVSYIADREEEWFFAPSTFPDSMFEGSLDVNAFGDNHSKPEIIGDTFETGKALFSIPSGLLSESQSQLLSDSEILSQISSFYGRVVKIIKQLIILSKSTKFNWILRKYQKKEAGWTGFVRKRGSSSPMEAGTHIWIPCDSQVWTPAAVLSHPTKNSTDSVQVQLLENGEIKIVWLLKKARNAALSMSTLQRQARLHQWFLCNNIHTVESLHCLTELAHLHEPSILHVLHQRYQRDRIYTFLGEILVALNPFKTIEDLYSSSQLALYDPSLHSDQLSSRQPHVFAVGGRTFDRMRRNRCNQSILVSGESGAGKTETAKYLLHFFTATQETLASGNDNSSKIGKYILQTNPILESFGNALTIRNDNSSRFGKFTTLQFDATSHVLIGARVASYLLEKVRLIHQAQDEQNFHIFYELYFGASQETKNRLLGGQNSFRYLPHLTQFTTSQQNAYTSRYKNTIQALSDIGTLQSERDDLLSLLGAVLHLGNVEFSTTDQRLVVSELCEEHLERAAELLELPVESLLKLMSTKKIQAGGETVHLDVSPHQAEEMCHSLGKFIYCGLFEWLVQRLNNTIDAGSASQTRNSLLCIGILDIFGFENVHQNGFEQLCINYANERIQAQFNECVFQKEQQIYKEQGILWKEIEYSDNLNCLSFFDDRVQGFFSLLNQECMLPKGSNEALITKLYRAYVKRGCSRLDSVLANVCFSAGNIEQSRFQFVIKHFAGHVRYELDRFLEKNMDTLPLNAQQLFIQSSNDILSFIGLRGRMDGESSSNTLGDTERLSSSRQVFTRNSLIKPTSDKRYRRNSTVCVASLSAQFRSQLDSLLYEIGKTEPHYIRCIKTNDFKEPNYLDRTRVVEQLRCAGVVEAARIARAGFSVRICYKEFIQQFKCVLSSQKRADSMSRNAALATNNTLQFCCLEICRALLPQSNLQDDFDACAFNSSCSNAGVQVGRTMIFCQQKTYEQFAIVRSECRKSAALCIQRNVRRVREERLYRIKVRSIITLQSFFRVCLARRFVQRRRLSVWNAAALRIQKYWRRYAVMRHAAIRRHSVIVIQASFRGFRTRKALKKRQRMLHRKAALKIQRFYRDCRSRRLQAKRFFAARLIQLWWRESIKAHSIKRSKDTQMPMVSIVTRRMDIDEEKKVNETRVDLESRNKALLHEIAQLRNRLEQGESKAPTQETPSKKLDSFYKISQSQEEHESANDHKDISSQPEETNGIQLLNRKIDDLTFKCDFLEQFVFKLLSKNGSEAIATGSERMSFDAEQFAKQIDDMHAHPERTSELLEGIHYQMEVIRQSLHNRPYRGRVPSIDSVASSRPTRTSSVSTGMSVGGQVPCIELDTDEETKPRRVATRMRPNMRLQNCLDETHDQSTLLDSNAPMRLSEISNYSRAVDIVNNDSTMNSSRLFRITKWARSSECYECHEAFNLFVWRHHCRLCGNSFCHEHSSRRVTLFAMGHDHEPVRVCDECYAEYQIILMQQMPTAMNQTRSFMRQTAPLQHASPSWNSMVKASTATSPRMSSIHLELHSPRVSCPSIKNASFFSGAA